jgi:3-deoxy-7-phosphoheptulonate synthase
MGPIEWNPYSWKSKPIMQQPEYEDREQLRRSLEHLSRLPPLVHDGEIVRLRGLLAEVAEGKRFLLQGGDCAELFDYCQTRLIENKLKIIIQMSLIFIWGARKPVVRIGRMAGQYAKPRSKATEILDNGDEVMAYRGDNVNGFDVNDRKPDPERLIRAYFHSAATLNYVRALIDGGFSNLHHANHWVLDHVRSSDIREQYESTVQHMLDSLDFIRTIGQDPGEEIKSANIFSSHEGLLLDYEMALTRHVHGTWYDQSAHFLWIGDRTRHIDGAHVEFFRGIENPIGVKVGPSLHAEELIELLNILNPLKEPGKVTLITRYGAGKVKDLLPKHIRAVKDAGFHGIVVWCCDPMHGNTEISRRNRKTRLFSKILEELTATFSILQEHGGHLGGVHFELSGESGVTECIGGTMELTDTDLEENYQTHCDPRLNYEQSLDVAFVLAQLFEGERLNKSPT